MSEQNKNEVSAIAKDDTDVRFDPYPIGDPRLAPNMAVGTFYANMVQANGSRTERVMSLRWFTKLPGVNQEVCRVAIPEDLARKLIDLLASVLDYYPTKPAVVVTEGLDTKAAGKKH